MKVLSDLPVDFPSIVTLPMCGRVTVPSVPAGTSMDNWKVLLESDHCTPYQPRVVSKPPSAAESPDVCGATDHVWPWVEATVRPRT
jgi:hypothetical protein